MSGVAVVALDAATYRFEAGALFDGSGAFDIGVDPGSYLVGFAEVNGTALFEWNADQPASGLASATPVAATAGSPGVVNATLSPAKGTIAGTVVEDGSGDPLADMWAVAIDSSGSVVGVAKTAADGTYTIANVPAGGVRVRFYDITDAHVPEYYDDHPGSGGASGYNAASIITVTGGATSTASAGLALTI